MLAKIKDFFKNIESKINKPVNRKILIYGIWIFVFAYLIFKIVVPFFLYNQLIAWDMAGHYFSSWYQAEYLFPHITGWNPFFFLGYPQGQFYPPMYFYITALLAQIFSLSFSFKIVLAGAILSAPWASYYFARSFGFSKLQSSCLMFFMFSLLFINSNSSGGDFYSTFDIGIVQGFAGMVLFFFYFGSLIRGVEKNKYLLPSFLFSFIILTHIVAAFAGVIAFIAVFFSSLQGKKSLLYFLKHGLLVVGLTAFWVFPYIAKISYMNSSQAGYGSPYIYVIIGATLIYSLIVSFKPDRRYFSVAFFLLLILAFSIIFSSYTSTPFHFYRLSMFTIMLLPVAFLSLFKKEKIIICLGMIAAGAIIILIFAGGLDVAGKTALNLSNPEKDIDGRVFVVSAYYSEPQPHFIQQFLPMQSKDLAIKGLYVESAKNGAFVLNMEHEIDKSSLIWGTKVYREFYNISLLPKILPYQFDLFNVNYVVSFLNNSLNYTLGWEYLQNITTYYDSKNDFSHAYLLYKVGNSSLIEVLDYIPRRINLTNETWEYETMKWFLSEDIKKGVLVNENVPQIKGNGNEIVKILNMSEKQDDIKFRVESEFDVPVLIKISEFSNWKAYVNGNKTKIYRASPYLMLVYGHGDMELKYESLFIDNFSAGLSILTVLIFVFILFAKTIVKDINLSLNTLTTNCGKTNVLIYNKRDKIYDN